MAIVFSGYLTILPIIATQIFKRLRPTAIKVTVAMMDGYLVRNVISKFTVKKQIQKLI
jgi:hypothetical protein